MKKIFLFLSMAALLMVGCNKNEDRVYSESAAAGIAGTYTGTWSLVDDKGTTSEAEGTVVFSVIEGEDYIVQLTFESAGLSLSASTRANVAHAGDDYVYYNNSAADLLPADAGDDVTVPSFQGRVSKDGSTTFSYKLKTGKGKKAKNNTYTFTGAR